jgi:hypothetical protein
MTHERRAFNFLPEYLRTAQNSREYSVADDVMFEPERSGFVSGYIGDVRVLQARDLERTPQIRERTAERQKYQLGIGTAYVNPETQAYRNGVFYTDLVNHLDANGALTDNPNRLFETPFYAWTPPIDYDKHINFSRYFWTGLGTADVNGEYVTKEAAGSQTTVYEVVDGALVKRSVQIELAFPGSPSVGDLVEIASTIDRLIYRWDGTVWVPIVMFMVEFTPTEDLRDGDFYYITQTGVDHNRPLIWSYSEAAGRWLSQPVVVSLSVPDTPRDGMIWEDSRLTPARNFKKFANGGWIDVNWVASKTLVGQPQLDQFYVYDARNLATEVTDGWAKNNWWRHYEDLSPTDRASRTSVDQAVRPIVEFWNGLESVPGDQRDARNDFPMFQLYAYRYLRDDIQPLIEAHFPGVGVQGQATIYQYQVGTGVDDFVLGFPLVFNDTGEFQFELTLETQPVQLTAGPLMGYRMFRDANTGLIHSIWAKSDVLTHQTADRDGLYDPPTSVARNPDHEVLMITSRSSVLTHMSSVIKAQTGFVGNEFGLNGYRWTRKNPTVGAVLVDCENTLFRAMATLRLPSLNIPDAIRQMARDYNRVLFKFITKMGLLWDENHFNDPAGTLLITPREAVDVILTELFVGRTEDFPFYYSDMGTYFETQMDGGAAVVIDNEAKPIFVPPSPARIGAIGTYRPEATLDRDGIVRLRGHDGVTIPSFQDDRDLIWLELQNRFFNRVQPYHRTETETFTSRFAKSNFYLRDHYGNSQPTTLIQAVDQVVQDYNQVVLPTPGLRVFSKFHAQFAGWDGQKWLTRTAQVDDVFENLGDNEFYIYNGVSTYRIERWNHPARFDYSTEEFRNIVRRDFERWVSQQDINFVDNTEFNPNDPFTWNYRSAGVEGHYKGIYKRIYNTIRPHSHPWEVMGYRIEPTWWRTQYVPDSIASDGTPRYGENHRMWSDFQAGFVHPILNIQRNDFAMIAPIPVDLNGELFDPIEAGVVLEDSLDPNRINDSWVFGDGADKEQEFYDSPFFAFTQALCGYLMKPGIWIDPLWTELYIDIGGTGTYRLWRARHVVLRDTLTRPQIGDLLLDLEIRSDGTTVQRLGVQAWISERLKSLGGDPTENYGKIVRNTKPSLGWNTSGFINDTRTKITTLSGKNIPFEDLHVVLHQSPPIKELVCSGILVTREGTGYRVYGYDLLNPRFRVELPAIPVAGGQVEQQEEFTATAGQHSFTTTQLSLPVNTNASDTAVFGVLLNGLKIKPQHVRVTSRNTFELESSLAISAGDLVVASVITTISNPRTQMKRFNVRGIDFSYFASGSGVFVDIEYGRYFDSSNEVINFMLSYGRALERDGWVFESQDETTGMVFDWLTGARLFADWVLRGTRPLTLSPEELLDIEAFTYSPVAQTAVLVSEHGQISNIESVMFGAYGILDKNAEPIDQNLTFVVRDVNVLTVTSQEAMYAVRAFITEYQHVVFFSNVTKFNDTIYDPVLALNHKLLKVETYKTQEWEGRPEADGFVMNDGKLLPNFEKQAFDFVRYYDRFNTVDDPVKRDQARNLYGWYPNDAYMDQIGAEDRSRFDYYRGMIKTKGTIRPAVAFARGSIIGADNFLVYEDWAWRLSRFGDERKKRVRFKINKTDFSDQIQIIKFGEPEIPGNNIIEVTDFNRDDPDSNDRWLIPPVDGQNLTGNLVLPTDMNGLPDVDRTKFYLTMFEVESGETVNRHFHYDPVLERFEPDAVTQLDYVAYFDPARYTNGPGQLYSNELSWGEEQVGQLWWATANRKYVDYHSLVPDYELVSREWGKLLYFRATLSRTDDIVRVNTKNPYTGAVAPHGLTTGAFVTITGANEIDYNGRYQITVTGPARFTYEIDTTPGVATGIIQVIVGRIDVYEWVKSPVPPRKWDAYVRSLKTPGSPTGTVLDADDASYVEQVTSLSDGRPVTYYYFWVLNNTGLNPNKENTSFEIALRLANPTITGVSWFAPINSQFMLVFADGEKVLDGYALEVILDQRRLDQHQEWVLISEGDRFHDIPTEVADKFVDTLAGFDQFGSVVPSPLLAEAERFGSDFFPPQTVFKDRTKGLKVYVDALNAVLKGKNLTSVDKLSTLFKLSDENTYWKRTAYMDAAYQGQKVFDTVASIAVRDDRARRKFYAEGDLVKVKSTDNVDPWTNSNVGATYVYTGSGFEEVGVDNFTIEIALTTSTDPQVIRDTYKKFPERVLEREEFNSVVFSMLYEMLRQNPLCDWFTKTSYISVQVFSELDNSSFVRPNEIDAFFNNIRDVKPFRTKFRSNAITASLGEAEPMHVDIQEFPDKKISLRVDRLSCDLSEDGGWDGYPWDTDLLGWDTPFWYFNDLGRQQWLRLGMVPADNSSTVFTVQAKHDPRLYTQRLVVFQGDEVVDIDEFGITYSFSTTHNSVTVTLSGPLSTQFVLDIQQSMGFYEGNEPALPESLEDTLFQPVTSTWEHHLARTMIPGIYNPTTEMVGCDVGNSPEERVNQQVNDSVLICVSTFHTQAYAAWDATPWDSAPWDQPPTDIGERVFLQSIGQTETIPAGIQVFPTSEIITTVNPTYVVGTHPDFDVAQYSLNGVPMTEGVEYERVDGLKHVIQFNTPNDILHTADGINILYSFADATSGLDKVFVDGQLKTNGVHYVLSGTNVQFVQPPPVQVPVYAVSTGRSYLGNAVITDFDTGLPFDSTNESNIFLFKNGLLLSDTDYVLDGANVSISPAPILNEKVMTFGFGNNVADTDAIFSVVTATGNGVQTTFSVGFGATTERTFVFVNGVYKVFGVGNDYTMPVVGQVTFAAAPANGAKIEFRILNPSAIASQDFKHVVLSASGTAEDNIIGIANADPNALMVFAGSVVKDGYATSTTPDFVIENGLPDKIKWIGTPPTVGTKISVRVCQTVQISTNTIFTIYPSAGSFVRLVPKPFMQIGDSILVQYNGWPVGDLGRYNVVSAPDDWDIQNGVLTLNTPVPPPFGNIVVNYTQSRAGLRPQNLMVRVARIIDDVLANHLIFDAPNGIEEGRLAGTKVVNTTTNRYLEWDGTSWIDQGPVQNGDQFFVRRKLQIISYNGVVYSVLYTVGDPYTSPPLLNFPLFGLGLTFGGYALGQLPDAATEFPEAYEVVQHPGSC